MQLDSLGLALISDRNGLHGHKMDVSQTLNTRDWVCRLKLNLKCCKVFLPLAIKSPCGKSFSFINAVARAMGSAWSQLYLIKIFQLMERFCAPSSRLRIIYDVLMKPEIIRCCCLWQQFKYFTVFVLFCLQSFLARD